MNCKELEKLVPLYHDGELSEAERKEFELHLSGCPECRKMLASLATLDELVRDGEAEKVPDPGEHYWQSFSQRVTHRLSEPRHLAVRRHRPKFFGLKLIPYLSAGVAVVFGIIIGIDLLQKAPGRFSQLKKRICWLFLPTEKWRCLKDRSLRQLRRRQAAWQATN